MKKKLTTSAGRRQRGVDKMLWKVKAEKTGIVKSKKKTEIEEEPVLVAVEVI